MTGSVLEFEAWPKIPRLNRDMVITEKIDGTNAAIGIERVTNSLQMPGDLKRSEDEWAQGVWYQETYPDRITAVVALDDAVYLVTAQSRKRLIVPGSDNFGFAKWVSENAAALVNALGEGRHFGEWWGQGIQRGYGLDEKRFSLFNVNRYGDIPFADLGLSNVATVPELHRRTFDTASIGDTLLALEQYGSQAAPGYMNPEGIIVFHAAANQVFKVTVKDDETPKELVKR